MYLFFIYAFTFILFFIYLQTLHIKKALESRGNFVVDFNWMWSKRKKVRKELKSVISAPPNRTEKNDCFQTDLPLSVIGLLSMMPPQTHITA